MFGRKLREDAMDDKSESPETREINASAEAAKDAAKHLMGEAEEAIREIKGRGIMGFFSFDTLYFPIIARYLFIVICVFSVIGVLFGMLGGFVSMATSFVAGLTMVIGSIIAGLMTIVGTRIWFELILLGFKINDGIQEIRAKTK